MKLVTRIILLLAIMPLSCMHGMHFPLIKAVEKNNLPEVQHLLQLDENTLLSQHKNVHKSRDACIDSALANAIFNGGNISIIKELFNERSLIEDGTKEPPDRKYILLIEWSTLHNRFDIISEMIKDNDIFSKAAVEALYPVYNQGATTKQIYTLYSIIPDHAKPPINSTYSSYHYPNSRDYSFLRRIISQYHQNQNLLGQLYTQQSTISNLRDIRITTHK